MKVRELCSMFLSILLGGLLILLPIEIIFPLLFFCLFLVFFWIWPKKTFCVFFLFLFFQSVIGFVLKSSIVFNFDELAVVGMVVSIVFKKLLLKQSFVFSKIYLLFLLITIIGFLGFVFNRVVPLSITLAGWFLFIKGLLAFFLLANLGITCKDIKSLKKILYVFGIITFSYGVLSIFLPAVFLHPIGIANSMRLGMPALQGYLGHPGVFAAFMGILFCLSFIDYLMQKKVIFQVMMVIFLIGVIFSFRRTTLLGVFISALLLFLFKSVRKIIGKQVNFKTTLPILIVILTFISVIFISYRNLFTTYLNNESPRSLLLQTGYKIAVDSFPLGSGFGTFSGGINQKFYSPLYYTYRLNHVWGLSKTRSSFINDTFWPHILAEVGFFGFGLYLFIIITFLLICLKVLSRKSNVDCISFAIFSLMILNLSFFESLKATFYENFLWTIFYFGSVGVLLSWLKEKKDEYFVNK